MILINYIKNIGALFIYLCQIFGKLLIFLLKGIVSLFSHTFESKTFMRQIYSIGYLSLPLIALTAIFTGAVLALQSYTGFARFNAENIVASVVVLSITRELGPVLVGLMLSGRVCAAIAAEIGAMKATEQIDALYTLGKDPMCYLVMPRILAGILVTPLLVLVADIIGVTGGYLVGVYRLDFSGESYIKNTFDYLENFDVISGLIKAAVFGLIVTLIGGFCGMRASTGSIGVGIATTTAVVSSSIAILFANYLITGWLFGH